MQSILLYVGPGLGVATIIIVVIVLLIILASAGMLIWQPIKNLLRKTRNLFSQTK
jgi:phosphotransferase system  glucose/maltose/N-acetylglucosamine-specific IIC component